MKKPILVSIMPTIDGRRRNDLHRAVEVTPDLPDEAVGEAIGDCLRNCMDAGHTIGESLIELQIRFA